MAKIDIQAEVQRCLKELRAETSSDTGSLKDFYAALDRFNEKCWPYFDAFIGYENNLMADYLGSVFIGLAYAKYPKLPGSEIEGFVIVLADLYTALCKAEFFGAESVDTFFLDHLKYHWHRKKYETKSPSGFPPKLVSKDALLPGEAAKVFQVEKRQVRRWIEQGYIKKRSDGRILWAELLSFSKKSIQGKYSRDYSHVFLNYHKAIRSTYDDKLQTASVRRSNNKPNLKKKRRTGK